MQVYSYDNEGNRRQHVFECFQFAGGEQHIRFQSDTFKNVDSVEIKVHLNNSDKVMQLLLAHDAIVRLTGAKIHLIVPYFPYARQDRVCVPGESLAVKVMANLINQLSLDKVTVWDAHSDVTCALLNNATNLTQEALFAQSSVLSELLAQGQVTLIAPDAGAAKKTMQLAKSFNGMCNVVQATKIRNLKTGEITKTEVHGDVRGKTVLMVDDICDGGRTFIELAKVLKQQGADKVMLYVTHGIFSNGFSAFKDLIDVIYTANAFNTPPKGCSDVQFEIISV